MNIPLNLILNLQPESLGNYRFQFNTHYGENPCTFIDYWNNHFTQEQKESGHCEQCAFYAREKDRDFLQPGMQALSFARLPDSKQEWLLITAGRITGITAENGGWADYDIDPRLQPLFGRLIVLFARQGQTYTRHVAEIINACYVKEILPQIYSGSPLRQGTGQLSVPPDLSPRV